MVQEDGHRHPGRVVCKSPPRAERNALRERKRPRRGAGTRRVVVAHRSGRSIGNGPVGLRRVALWTLVQRAVRGARASRLSRSDVRPRGAPTPRSDERELVARLRARAERFGRRVQPFAVMQLELPRTARRVVDRVAVPGQCDLGIELDRPVERGEVVAERIRPARRPETDGRRERPKEMVGRDEDAVANEAQLPIGVAWRGNRAPSRRPARLPPPGWDRAGSG